MFEALSYPYERAQTYTDSNLPAVLSDQFYNPTQDNLALLFGALYGQSASIAKDEFERESNGFVTVGGLVGSQFLLQSATNAKASSASGAATGDHGIWLLQNDAGGALHDIIIYDSDNYVGTRRFIWAVRLQLTAGTKAALDTAANSGIVAGMGTLASNLPTFYGGSDQANWRISVNAATYDSGVALSDSTWYWLVVARQTNNDIKFWIKSGAGALTLVRTVSWGGNLTGCKRYLRCLGTAGSAAGHGLNIDMFTRGIER